jgi:hypothetical protein
MSPHRPAAGILTRRKFDMGMGIGQANAATDRSASRIEHDVELVKTMIEGIERTTDRIIRHARALGYYEPTPESKLSAPSPVITTLADALQALGLALDHCSGSLNVFD